MTKEELKGYIETKREMEIIEEKLEFLHTSKGGVKSMVITDMPRGGSSEDDRLLEIMIEIEKLEEMYNKKRLKLMKQLNEIENVIDSLEEPIDRNIMRMRYIKNYTWERICVELNYSWNGIHKRHRKILDKIR